MRVAILGAGALGLVYGGYLAVRAHVSVTLVVRPGREHGAPSVRLERADGDGDAFEWSSPARATSIPADAELVIVCVRHEQLDDALIAQLRNGPDVPAVIMTPMFPVNLERLSTALPERIIAAMPGIAAYVNRAGAVRHWLPRVAPTLVDAPADPSRAAPGAVKELVAALNRAGIPAKLEPGVHELNPATTASFVPLTMALDVAGGVDALLADDALLDLGIRAAEEGVAFARTLGRTAAWAGVLLKFVGPKTLRLGVTLARARAPEAVAYVDEHFGRKLHAQNVAMAREMIALAEARGTPHVALDALLTRLEAGG